MGAGRTLRAGQSVQRLQRSTFPTPGSTPQVNVTRSVVDRTPLVERISGS